MKLPYTEGDPKTARVAIVGEAPGKKEEELGRPFVGASGTLLDKILAACGLGRSSCYLTNVVKERPPGNNIEKFIKFDRVNIITSPSYDSYEEVLLTELKQLSNLQCIILMGNVPLHAVLRKRAITKQRGSYFEWNNTPVIPTIHPAAALRNYIDTHLIRADFSKVRRLLNGEDISPIKQDLYINPTFDEAIDYIKECHRLGLYKGQRIGCDTEVVTTSTTMEVSHVSLSHNKHSAISINFIKGYAHHYTEEEELSIWIAIAELLENPKIRKILQSVMFDAYFLFRKYGIRTTNYDDTLIAQALSLPDYKKDLGFICSIHTRTPYYKDEGKKHFKRDIIAGDAFHRYSAQDARVLLEAWPSLESDLKQVDNIDVYNKVIELTQVLLFMEAKGILIDTDRLQQVKKDTDEQIDETINKIKKLMGDTINTGSVKQLMAYFYDKKGIKPYLNRKTGKPRIDEDALIRLAGRGFPEASMIIKKRKAQKLKSTYLDVVLTPDHLFRMALNPVGTKQLRLSSGTNIFGEGTNGQNLPKPMKNLITARPGFLIAEVDKSQAENRMVAYIAPELRMIEAFEKYDKGLGPDVHRMTAGLLLDKDPYEISDEPGSCELGDGTKSERDWGKTGNHSLNYGMGPNTLAFRNNIPQNQAKYLWTKYHRVYPGVHIYHNKVRNELNKSRTLTNIFGFSYRFLDRWGDALFRQAYNFNPQSSVAYEINFKGLVPIYNIDKPEFEYVILLNQIHDSIVLEIPINIGFASVVAVLFAIKETMEEPIDYPPFTFSIPIDCKIGKSLGGAIKINWKESRTEIAKKLKKVYEG